MPKPKQFLKENKKKSKHAPQVPTTADEYLAAGVDFEEAGEKWRGGDAAKSTRFFIRAIDCYDEALKKFPYSFDLAYNKARLQYELTQHSKLLQQLPGTLLELLQTAIESSRYALKLNQQNADVLFNTAQALTSYVEALQESDKGSPVDPLPLLEESLELFQQCLTLQELQYQEYQELQQKVAASSTPDNQDYDPEEGGVSLASTSSMDIDSELSTPSTDRTIPMDIPSSPPQLDDDRWATIVEPVTNSSLLDTLIAQLQALATLCTLLPVPSGEALDYIASYAKGIIDIKLDAYVIGTGRDIEALIARDDYFCAWADTQYHNGLCTVQSYYNIVTNAYAFEGFDTHAEALCKRAEALIGFHHTVRASPDAYQHDSLTASWEALSTALGCLAKASKLPDVENLAAIHITRGDAELLRFQMGKEQVPYEPAEKYAAALVKNAEVFYRGGKNEARARGMEALEMEGTVKEALARGLKGENEYIVELVKTRAEAAKVIGDAVDDGFVRKEQLEQMGLNF